CCCKPATAELNVRQKMTTPQLRGFDCIDYDPIDEWQPSSSAEVYYSLCLHIGTPDEEGADLFYVDVATPQAINELNLGKRMSERGIVVNPYSWENVLNEVQGILERCKGEDWNQQSELLAKHFNWEFENCRPYSP
ncbi:MAG: Imm8 family immunity protein, partial [Verrucomicrobiota bacterium]